jgi:hypothetical protein
MYMKKILVLLVGTATLMTSSFAHSDDQSSGCGLGWQVTQRMSIVSSAVRLTTDTVLPNTFSMTSGTSGCARHDLVKNDEKAVLFAVNNYDSLIVEMAQGSGEFLEGFAQALGCNEAAFSKFSTFTQSRYQKIFENSANDGINLYKAVRTEIQASPELATQCVPTV